MTGMVTIIVVNWNSWGHTEESVTSVLPFVHAHLARLVIVDNASSDNSVSSIQRWISAQSSGIPRREIDPLQKSTQSGWITLVCAPDNRGFAAGNNIGLRYSLRNTNSQFFWLLNHDTVAHPEALTALLRCAQASPTVGMFGSTLVDYYDRDRVQCAGGARYHVMTTRNKLVLAGKPVRTVIDMSPRQDDRLDYIAGASLFIRREVVERIGLMNEDYFLFYEELDYAYRAKPLGYGLGWCRDSIVYHKGGASTGSRSSMNKAKSSTAEFHSTLSALKFTQRFYPALLLFVCAARLILKLFSLAARREWHLMPALLGAYVSFFRSRK